MEWVDDTDVTSASDTADATAGDDEVMTKSEICGLKQQIADLDTKTAQLEHSVSRLAEGLSHVLTGPRGQ